jgi:hypothetical protein
MATGDLKVDRINGAYSQMRISGITVQPSAEDNVLALSRMEAMAHEFNARNICTGYNTEDEPDINSSSGLPPSMWYAFDCVLAQRLLSDFGKGAAPDPLLLTNASAQMSFLCAVTANPRQTQYPSRMPTGSGNRWNSRFYRFYKEPAIAPNECATNYMYVDDIADFVEHFDSFIIDSETISSYTISADTGLTIQTDSTSDFDVNYRIKATKEDPLLRVKIIMTTSTGRIETRIINFAVTKAPEIS